MRTQNSLKCFGVGDGMGCADRNHSSFLYRLGRTTLLVDCGEPVSRSLKASGLGHDAIDGIVLSHLHSDHAGGFFMLMQAFWLERLRKNLVVHLPADAIAPVRTMMKAAYLFDELFRFKLGFEPLVAERPAKVGQVRITPYPTSHLDSLRRSFRTKYPGDYAAFAFLIEAGGLRIVHSADLGAPEDLAPMLTQPADLLVCELAHFEPEALFRYLRGKDVRRIVFMHLGRPYWERFADTQRLAARMLPGVRIDFARDQQEFRWESRRVRPKALREARPSRLAKRP